MNRKDASYLTLLGCLAIYIWGRDLSWLEDMGNTLPVAFAIPLFVWLGTPWTFRRSDSGVPFPQKSFLAMIALMILGTLLGSTFVLSLGWTAALWAWLKTRIPNEDWQRVQRLLVLPVLAFPWIITEGDAIGWYFRMSGAAVADMFLQAANFASIRQGTFIFLDDVQLNIADACSGLRTLQVMLITGTAVAFIQIHDRRRYWWHLPILFGIAWVANTLRILAIGIAAVTFGADFARDFFHLWGGLGVVCLMFAMCQAFFTLARSCAERASKTSTEMTYA